MLRQVAKDYQEQYPRASRIVSTQIYVDDCLTGASSVAEAIEIRADLNALLAAAGTKHCKWRSHSQELLRAIPDDMKEKENLTISPPDQCHKALGFHWDTRTDSFHVVTPFRLSVQTQDCFQHRTNFRFIRMVRSLYGYDQNSVAKALEVEHRLG